MTTLSLVKYLRKCAGLILVFSAHFYNIGKGIACAYLSHGEPLRKIFLPGNFIVVGASMYDLCVIPMAEASLI